MEEITIEYPIFVPCDEANWAMFEKQANNLLGLPSNKKETYSNPFKDKNGQIYFIVNEDVANLFKDESGELSDQNTFLKHNQIEWPKML